jgi:flagellar hook-basal body complex protein FliE
MNEVSFPKQLPTLIGAEGNTRAKEESDPASFGNLLSHSIDEVDQLHASADAAVEKLAAGKQTDIHQTMIALEKADVAFQLLMQVRNKIIAAYETIMRMQA